MTRLHTTPWAVAAFCALLPALASANEPDTFGMGFKTMGRGMAGVSAVDDASAAMVNPATFSQIHQPTFIFGFSWATFGLRPPPPVYWDTNRDGLIDASDPPLEVGTNAEDAAGLHLHFARHLSKKFAFGLSAYVPVQRLFRLRTIEPSLPTYIMYGNRLQRYAVSAGAGGEVLPGVSIGASVDIMPKVYFSVGLTADASVQAAQEGDEDLGDLLTGVVVDTHEVQLDVLPGFIPVVGLMLDFGRWTEALEGLKLGATWRGAGGLNVDAFLDAQVNLHVQEVGSIDPIDTAIVAQADLSLFDHYIPMKVDFGGSYFIAERVLVALDARWMDWRPMQQSLAVVTGARVTAPLFQSDDLITDGNPIDVVMKSTWSVRGGVDVAIPRIEKMGIFEYLAITPRLGGGFEQSPLVSQSDASILLDSDRFWITGGFTLETANPFKRIEGALRFEGFLQYHRLGQRPFPRATDSPRAGFPVNTGGLYSEGDILVLGGGIGMDF